MTDSKKRLYLSSSSDIDTSLDLSKCSTPQAKSEESLTKAQRKKKAKIEKREKELSLNMSASNLDLQLTEINEVKQHVN